MSEIEHLINSQKYKISTLSSEVENLTQHLKDFEVLAQTWKKGYEEMERDFRKKLANAEQTIEELEKELRQALETIENIKK